MTVKGIKIEILNSGILFNRANTIRDGIELLPSPHQDYILNRRGKSYKIKDVCVRYITRENDSKVYDVVISKKIIDSKKTLVSDDFTTLVINTTLSEKYVTQNCMFEETKILLLLVDKNDMEEI